MSSFEVCFQFWGKFLDLWLSRPTTQVVVEVSEVRDVVREEVADHYWDGYAAGSATEPPQRMPTREALIRRKRSRAQQLLRHL